MATLSFARYLLLFLAFFLVVETIMPGVEAATCQTVLARSGCNILQCRQQCAQRYGGRGVCVANTQRTDYGCLCFYDCHA